MKRWEYIALFFILFIVAMGVLLISESQAQVGYLCEDDQTLLKLFDVTNSHGEAWNGGGGYGTEICFDEIFGALYNPESATNHVCTGSNVVVRLSLDSERSNGHAEEPYPDFPDADYVDVCFGNLECTVVDGECGDTLPVSFKEVLALTDNTNSHMSAYGQVHEINYDYRLCCKAEEFINVEWQDFAGETIGQGVGIASFVNRTVKLYTDSAFLDGTEVTFEIYEDESGSDDEIRTLSLGNALTGVVSGGVGVVNWKITDADMVAGDDGEDDIWEFFFIATAKGVSAGSDLLDVNPFEGPDSNPVANITGPTHKQIYYIGTNIEFTHDSFDIEGPLQEIEWTIEQKGFSDFKSNEDSFNLDFGTDYGGDGQATITLRVVDDSGLEDEDQISILIVSSPGIIAYINKPFHHEVVVDNDLIVRFEGKDSYVINSEGAGCPTVTCEAGSCPAQTKNVPTGCVGLVNLTVVGSEIVDYSTLKFDWTFDDDLDFHYPDAEQYGLVEGEKIYPIQSRNFNDKEIGLNLIYDDLSLAKDTERIFSLLNGNQCLGGIMFVTIEEGRVVQQEYTLNSGACAGNDGLAGTRDDCCPGAHLCNIDTGCYIPEGEIPRTCSEYLDDDACNDDLYGLGDLTDGPPNDPGLEDCIGSAGGVASRCSCTWLDSTGECYLAQEANNYEDPIDDGTCTEFVCLYSTDVLQECQNGFMEISVEATLLDSSGFPYNFEQCAGVFPTPEEAGCVGGIRVVPCGQLSFDLNFFDFGKQGLSALLIIALVYFFIVFGKRDK